MARTGQRAVRLAVVLPPLVFVAVFGYWRFLGSDSFRALVETILEGALSADVTVGSHKVESPARIALHDLAIEFRSDGEPSGVRLTTTVAEARSGTLLGVGRLQDVVLTGAEATFVGSPADVARLDLLKGPKAGLSALRIEGMTLSFAPGGRRFRVRDTDWDMDFSGGAVKISGRVERLRVDGLESAALEEEAPAVAFDLEVEGRRVRLSDLSLSGSSGWKMKGVVEADFGREALHLAGDLSLWGLPLSRIYAPKPGVEISSSAHVEQAIQFAGPVDNVRFEVTTNLKGVSYADKRLGLDAEGVTVNITKVTYYDLKQLVAALAEGAARADRGPPPGGGPAPVEGEAGDAGGDVQD